MAPNPTTNPARPSAVDRLRAALAEMLRQQASGSSPQALNATTLCQLARVSRNALYRYHRDVLHELHQVQQQQHRYPDPTKQDLFQLRGENDALREQVTKLVTLVDHYYAAWQENRTLLERRERELAEVRRNTKSPVFSIRN